MQVAAARRTGPAGAGHSAAGSGAGAALTSSLTMYVEAPREDLTLEDFEVAALDRLKMLKGIETAKGRGVKGAELIARIRELLKECLGTPNEEGYSRKDQVGHHILRLAYSMTEENRRWFMQHEVLLFRHRLERETPEQQQSLMAKHGLTWMTVSDADRADLAGPLKTAWDAAPWYGGVDGHGSGGAGADDDGADTRKPDFASVRFFKVPFVQALELVKSREVLLRGGLAYVPQQRIVTIVVNRFRAYISRSLVFANKSLPLVLRDERLGPMLTSMAKAYLGPEYTNGGAGKAAGVVTAEQVPGLARTAFPLCMQNLHDGMFEAHHLKHGGRMQYGLFLKGLGVPLEESLVFWQKEFTKKMSPDEFVKKFAYNIRHNYGKEGKRTDYTPFSCTKIISGAPPSAGDFHGCPYRHWDVSQLKARLGKMSMSAVAVESIVESVRSKDYQIACRKQFEARFPGIITMNVGNHPNAYAEEALGYIRGQAAEAAKTAAAAAGGVSAAAPASVSAAGAASAGGGGGMLDETFELGAADLASLDALERAAGGGAMAAGVAAISATE